MTNKTLNKPWKLKLVLYSKHQYIDHTFPTNDISNYSETFRT